VLNKHKKHVKSYYNYVSPSLLPGTIKTLTIKIPNNNASGSVQPKFWHRLRDAKTLNSLSTRDSEESTTMKLDIESQLETEIMAESGQNGE
jgi:hypothetical protein